MRRLIGPVTLLVTALVLAGCSGDTPDDGEAQPVEASAPSIAEINAQPVTPSEGDIELTPLAADAGEALDAAGRTCAFAYQGRTLLWAGEGEQGLRGKLIADGRALDLEGAAQALDTGAALGDGSLTVLVQPAEGSRETADLVLAGPQGETRFSPGTWTCSS